MKEPNSFTLDHRGGFLCVLSDVGIGPRKWFPICKNELEENLALLGRPLTAIAREEGSYIDEDGNVYQLMNKGETKPLQVEDLSENERSKLEVLLEASLEGRAGAGQNRGPKQLFRKTRSGRRRQLKLQVAPSTTGPKRAENSSPIEPGAPTPDGATAEDSVRLNLRQKLAEVRRRIGYIQKRGHNERFNYSYVTAADIAGSVGDLLAELGVVVIPSLENITYESTAGRDETTRMARVVMAYTFSDVDSGEEIVAKVAGQGLDAGDKAPYKAMTGALKYALL